MRDDNNTWWNEAPEPIESVGMQYIKWQELYKFWRKFVPEQYHKDWKYYAEDLPEEQKKKLSTQKEESRLQRQERARVKTVQSRSPSATVIV